MQSIFDRSQRDQASQIRSERFYYVLWFVDKEKSMAYIFFPVLYVTVFFNLYMLLYLYDSI